jgi:hypothetical protein
MYLQKILIFIIMIFIALGVSSGQTVNDQFLAGSQAWIQENPSATSVLMSDLTANIHIHIKNTLNHVQYFKISQQYFGTLTNNSSITWKIDWTDPAAVKMIKSTYPEIGGDYGWRINPGETMTICFKLSALGPMGGVPAYMTNDASSVNQYWPLVPEPGIYSSWFLPDEIEWLNPSLDLKFWQGTFSFILKSYDSKRVEGIVRAPIVPIDSKLTNSNPPITYVDKDLMPDSNTAAWDVNMQPGQSNSYTYTYQWPFKTKESGPEHAQAAVIPSSTAKKTPSVPLKQTGVPYGLLIVGGLVSVVGLAYARYLRR